MDRRYINKIIDTKFFDFPKNIIKSWLIANKFKYLRSSIDIYNPCIIICNRSSEFDEYLIRCTLTKDYVVLKTSVIEKIYNGSFSNSDKKELFADMKILKEALVSVVIFPENQISIFGKSQNLPLEITELLYEFNMNLKFINFADAYFSKPIWSTKFRITNTRYNSRFNLTNKFLSTLSPEERNSKINKCMPSSASVYSHKSNLQIKSNCLAQGFESVVFACPNCKEFFSLKSEYNNLKCKNCSIPFECTQSGEIYTNGQTISFDELEMFLNECLNDKKFSKKIVNSLDNITFYAYLDEIIIHKQNKLKVDIFENKINLTGENFEKLIDFKDVISCIFLPNNTLKFTLKSTEVISIQAHNNDNIYIILALYNKQKTQRK